MIRAFCRLSLGVCAGVGSLLAAFAVAAAEGPPNGGGEHGGPHGSGGRPTYQRRAFDWNNKGHDRRRDRFRQPWVTPQVSSGWFQRPYPYHLDYYKMKWGGSYAPYFGNLYGTPFGTPQVVYGGWGLGAGGWEGEPGTQPQGVEAPVWTPYALPPGAVMGQAVESNRESAAGQDKNESLPAPVK